MADTYATILEMAADSEVTPLQYMMVELGWQKSDAELWLSTAAIMHRDDAYTAGYCKRCGQIRRDCQAVIDSGGRCTDPLPDLPRFMVSPDLFEVDEESQ